MDNKGLQINYNEVWQKALVILKDTVQPSTYDPWISPLVPALPNDEHFKEGFFTLKSSGQFAVNHLNRGYLPQIKSAVEEIIKQDVSIEVVFDPNDVKKPPKKKKQKKEEHIILMEEQLENLKQMHSFCALNLKYTFENFVEGENSKVAFNAAKLIADAPGQKFNPLFITGSVGMGKTHLMQAVGHRILKNFPKLKVKYAKTEEFTNRLIEACKSGDSTGAMKKFRDQYRNVDVLLMDDIQFAEGKKRTEEEIFNTFEALYNLGKQIIFASERGYETFTNTPERLKTRYGQGLSVEILPPSLEVRMEIVKRHAKRSNYDVSDDVARLLAMNYSKNVRELEGAYNKVSAYASIQGIELTVESASDILGLNNLKKQLTVQDVVSAVAEFYQIKPESILGKDRSKNVQEARQVSIYTARELLDLSYPILAKSFDRNHTTIMYSCKAIEDDIKTNLKLKSDLDKIQSLIMK